MNTNLIDGDYVLIDGAAWIEAGPFVVRVYLQPTGLVVDVYRSGEEMNDPLRSVYAEMPETPTEGVQS